MSDEGRGAESESGAVSPDFGDVPSGEFRAALHRAADWVADYREGIERLRVSPDTEPGDVVALLPEEMPDAGAPLSELFDELDRLVLPHVVNWGHPSFLGYFGSTTTAPGVLGEMLAAALNVSAMTWCTSPAATELEQVVLGWMRRALGLSEEFTGVVYDTASVALLHALAAAREGLGLDARRQGLAGRADVPRLRVYASDQAHSSVEKAAVTIGVGEANVRRVETGEDFRMKAAALAAAIDEDVRAGALPLAVVATVGTTSTAAVDPVEEVAAICRERGVWLHVDAAYGGALALLEEYAPLARLMNCADSLVVNPHKWLFVPLDFSALYTRRPDLLRATFSLVPEYLRGDAERGEVNYMDYGVQLGRRFRALKAWAVFRTFGRAGLRSRIRRHLRLAASFAGRVERARGFELAAPPSMAVVCFRALPEPGDSAGGSGEREDELNRALVAAVNATGRAYLTHTTLRGRVAARVAFGNVLTDERHASEAFALLEAEAARLRTS